MSILTSRAGHFAAIIVALPVLLFLACAGATQPLELSYRVVAGWFIYLTRTLPKVRVDGVALGSALLWLALFAVGLHSFCRWLYRALHQTAPPGTAIGRWRMRWTALLVGLVILLFSAGTAAVCVAHQIGFLATSDEPMFAIPVPRPPTTNDLRDTVEGHYAPLRQNRARAEDVWQDVLRPRHPRGGAIVDTHQVIAWNGPHGTLEGILVFHRDPDERAAQGLIVGLDDCVVVRSAEELPRLLRQLPQPSTKSHE